MEGAASRSPKGPKQTLRLEWSRGRPLPPQRRRRGWADSASPWGGQHPSAQLRAARAGGLGSRSRKCSHPDRKSRAGSPPRRFTRTRDLLLSALATWASLARRGARGRDALLGVRTATAAPVRVRTAPLRPRRGWCCWTSAPPRPPIVRVRTVPLRPRRGVARCHRPDCTTAAQAGVVVLRWRLTMVVPLAPSRTYPHPRWGSGQ